MNVDLTRQGIITRITEIEKEALTQSVTGRGTFLFMNDNLTDQNIYIVLDGGEIQPIYNASIISDSNNNIILAKSSGTNVMVGDVTSTSVKLHVNGQVIIDGNINSNQFISFDTNNTIGLNAGSEIETGLNNLIVGYNSGLNTLTSLSLSTANDVVYLGANILPSDNNITNEIVIGANGEGRGSNTTMVGNNQTTKTYLAGDVYIGYGNTDNNLYVNGNETIKNLLVSDSASFTSNSIVELSGIVNLTGFLKDSTNNFGTNKILISDSFGRSIWKTKKELALIDGAGTNNYIPMFTSGSISGVTSGITIGNSIIYQNGPYVGFNTTTPLTEIDIKLETNQHIQFSSNTYGNVNGVPGIISINDAGTAYTPIGFFASKYYFGNGNVGYGTTNPRGRIHVVGDSIIDGNVNSKYRTSVTNTNSIGNLALGNLTAGYSNVGIGTKAGAYTSTDALVTTAYNSTYIGSFAKAGVSGSTTNEIVIGANAIGHGSNTTTIGTSGTTNAYMYGNLLPPTSNSGYTIGSAVSRWNDIYLVNSPNVVSDENLKTQIIEFSIDELNAAKSLAKIIGVYKLLFEVENFGSDAGYHIGLSAQKVIEILTQNNLNPEKYSFIGYENGHYSLKYTELIMFILRGFEERLSALENI